MSDENKDEPKPRAISRDDIRKALTCPICKTPGVMLGDKCQRCGSYQDGDGQWITPAKTEERRDDGKTWDWRD